MTDRLIEMMADTRRMVGRVEGKLDAALAGQRDHGQRLVRLEAFKNRVLGICIIVTGSVTWAANLIFKGNFKS
jgi:hypothetical protein